MAPCSEAASPGSRARWEPATLPPGRRQQDLGSGVSVRRQPASGVSWVGWGDSGLLGQAGYSPGQLPVWTITMQFPVCKNVPSASAGVSRVSITSPPRPGPAGPLGGCLGTLGTAMGRAPALHAWSWQTDIGAGCSLGFGEPWQGAAGHSGQEAAALGGHSAASAAPSGAQRAGARRLGGSCQRGGSRGPPEMPSLSSPRSHRPVQGALNQHTQKHLWGARGLDPPKKRQGKSPLVFPPLRCAAHPGVGLLLPRR